MLLLIRNLTNIDSLNYTILSSITILEAITLFFGLFLLGITVRLATQAPFHWNLLLIITLVLSQYYIAIVSRLVMLALQMHLVPLEGEFESSTLVMICSLCRLYYFATSCMGIIMVFVERFIANILIVDYETKFRRYIGIILSINMVISSIVASSLVIFEHAPWVIIAICVVFTGMLTTTLFMLLLRKNQRSYNRLVVEPTKNNDSTIRYTLSIRFQLNENIRSMTLLRNLVIFGTMSNLICFVLLAGANIDWMHFHSDLIGHYFDAVLNLYISLYGSSIPIVGYYSDDIYKDLVRELPIIGSFFGRSNVLPRCKIIEDGNVYFVNLQMQWNGGDTAKRLNRVQLNRVF